MPSNEVIEQWTVWQSWKFLCEEQIEETIPIYEPCCDNLDLIKNNGANICKSCGSLHGYELASEYIDFHDVKYKIRKKSIYHRKYHLLNKVDSRSKKNKIDISYDNKDKILRVFKEIDKILIHINGDRKRMICINFILKKLFKMLNLSNKDIYKSQSKKTNRYYYEYWNNILSLIGNKIQKIINQ